MEETTRIQILLDLYIHISEFVKLILKLYAKEKNLVANQKKLCSLWDLSTFSHKQTLLYQAKHS